MNNAKEEKYKLVIINNNSLWKPVVNFRSKLDNSTTCRKCGSTLRSQKSRIPTRKNSNQGWEIPGYYCQKCNCLYIEDTNKVFELLKDNKNAIEYSINGKSIWNYSGKYNIKKILQEKKAVGPKKVVGPKKEKTPEEEEKARLKKERKAQKEKCINDFSYAASHYLEKIPFAVVALLFNNRGTTKEFIITSEKVDQLEFSPIGITLLYYKDVFARELLTAAYHKSRNGNSYYNNENYNLMKKIENTSKTNLIPSSVKIKPGAGYFSNSKGHTSLIDLLIYSPYTKRFELCKSSYDEATGEASMDIAIFRKFIQDYGYDINCIPLTFHNEKTRTIFNEDVNTESILKGYGYSVSQKDDLSASYRQKILAEIVDLNILEVKKIVRYLDFFIKTHPLEKDLLARNKWAQDKAFISKYRVNPKRFMIMS